MDNPWTMTHLIEESVDLILPKLTMRMEQKMMMTLKERPKWLPKWVYRRILARLFRLEMFQPKITHIEHPND